MPSRVVFDRRDIIGTNPGVHAFVIGISNYLNLPDASGQTSLLGMGLRQLSSAALTGYQIYNWLKDHRDELVVPLASVRLLIAPSETELIIEPALEEFIGSCCLEDFLVQAKEWRSDASANRDGVALFYFAGHGVQRLWREHALLLQDFGDGIGTYLYRAVDTSNLYRGMAPTASRPDIARRQLYFIDACRLAPEEAVKYEKIDATLVWNERALYDTESEEVIPDDRDAPLFHSTRSGAASYGVSGEQTVFSQALIRSLDGGAAKLIRQRRAGRDEWGVSTDSLPASLKYHLTRLSEEKHIHQECLAYDVGPGHVIRHLASPPMVDVTYLIDPVSAAEFARIAVMNDEQKRLRKSLVPIPQPFKDVLPGGRYTVRATATLF